MGSSSLFHFHLLVGLTEIFLSCSSPHPFPSFLKDSSTRPLLVGDLETISFWGLTFLEAPTLGHLQPTLPQIHSL